MTLIDGAFYILSMGLGFVIGYWAYRMTEDDRRRNAIIHAWNAGREAGIRRVRG